MDSECQAELGDPTEVVLDPDLIHRIIYDVGGAAFMDAMATSSPYQTIPSSSESLEHNLAPSSSAPELKTPELTQDSLPRSSGSTLPETQDTVSSPPQVSSSSTPGSPPSQTPADVSSSPPACSSHQIPVAQQIFTPQGIDSYPQPNATKAASPAFQDAPAMLFVTPPQLATPMGRPGFINPAQLAQPIGFPNFIDPAHLAKPIGLPNFVNPAQLIKWPSPVLPTDVLKPTRQGVSKTVAQPRQQRPYAVLGQPKQGHQRKGQDKARQLARINVPCISQLKAIKALTCATVPPSPVCIDAPSSITAYIVYVRNLHLMAPEKQRKQMTMINAMVLDPRANVYTKKLSSDMKLKDLVQHHLSEVDRLNALNPRGATIATRFGILGTNYGSTIDPRSSRGTPPLQHPLAPRPAPAVEPIVSPGGHTYEIEIGKTSDVINENRGTPVMRFGREQPRARMSAAAQARIGARAQADLLEKERESYMRMLAMRGRDQLAVIYLEESEFGGVESGGRRFVYRTESAHVEYMVREMMKYGDEAIGGPVW